MTFFYLPDEVKYHRLPARFLSLPKGSTFECARFEVVTAAVRAQSTSLFSEAEFVCAPGEVNPSFVFFVCIHAYGSSNYDACMYTSVSCFHI